jgi:hypothetical protein
VNRHGALRNPKSNLQNQRGNIVRKSLGKIAARYKIAETVHCMNGTEHAFRLVVLR